MVEPATLAVGAVAALVPYLAEAGKGMATKAGEAVWQGCEKLWSLLKSTLTKPEQQSALEDLCQHPENKNVQGAATWQVEKALMADAAFAQALADVLESLPESGGQRANVVGDNNIVGQADRGSTITFNR
jgi:hypothetical protein